MLAFSKSHFILLKGVIIKSSMRETALPATKMINCVFLLNALVVSKFCVTHWWNLLTTFSDFPLLDILVLLLPVKCLKIYQFLDFHSLYSARVILKMKHSLVVTEYLWSGSRVKFERVKLWRMKSEEWNLPTSVL